MAAHDRCGGLTWLCGGVFEAALTSVIAGERGGGVTFDDEAQAVDHIADLYARGISGGYDRWGDGGDGGYSVKYRDCDCVGG